MNLTLFVVSVLFGLVNQCALFCQAGPPGSIQMNVSILIHYFTFENIKFSFPKIINHAGKSVNVFWINTFSPSRNGELNLVKQTTKSLRNCSDSQVSSTFSESSFEIPQTYVLLLTRSTATTAMNSL
jgi:hypothetical protein